MSTPANNATAQPDSGTPCPVCGHQPCPIAWRYHDTPIHRCAQCGLEFAAQMQAASLDYYQDNYSAGLIGELRADQVHPGYRYIVDTVRRVQQAYLAPDRRRALDVGCGSGYMLSQLKQLGFEARGIDFDPALVQFAREHFQAQAEVAKLEDLAGLALSFDFVLLNHVLEHAAEPLALLRSIARVLDAGGILLIDLPNANRYGLNRSLRRGELQPGEYPPHHLTFWSVVALQRALELAQLSVVECFARPFSQDDRIAAYLNGKFCRAPAGLRSGALRLARRLGDGLRLQGDTLTAVARRIS